MTTGTMMVCSQGVKLKVVEAVLDKAQGQGLVTTQDVHDMLISPATADAGCAYIDTLNDSLKGPATCIVSHAWASPWQDTVDVMRQVEAETPNTLFWLDLLTSCCRTLSPQAPRPGALMCNAPLPSTITTRLPCSV
eukprot:m.33711 g.33711  ORF g.33711 m.33711 type:complete len:136 (-) comp9656_c0_seq2:1745-2152(-)